MSHARPLSLSDSQLAPVTKIQLRNKNNNNRHLHPFGLVPQCRRKKFVGRNPRRIGLFSGTNFRRAPCRDRARLHAEPAALLI